MLLKNEFKICAQDMFVPINEKTYFWARPKKKAITQDPMLGLGQISEYTIKDITKFSVMVWDKFVHAQIFSTYVLEL